MEPRVAPSALRVPHSRIRELADIAMSMDGVVRLYFGESNVPTPDYIKRAAARAMAAVSVGLPRRVSVPQANSNFASQEASRSRNASSP